MAGRYVSVRSSLRIEAVVVRVACVFFFVEGACFLQELIQGNKCLEKKKTSVDTRIYKAMWHIYKR